MPNTVRDLSELTTVAADDMFLVSDTSDVLNRDKRISRLNLLGTNITGGGSISTGGKNVSFPADGIVAMKTSATPAVGASVRWLDGNTIEGGGVLFDWLLRRPSAVPVANELAVFHDAINQVRASGIPYTDVARLGVAQTFSAVKTYSAGINVGGGTTNMTYYENGTFVPRFSFGGGDGGHTTSTMTGTYVRVGTMVSCEIDVRLSALGTAAGAVRITDLPFTANGNRAIGTVRWTAMTTAYTYMIGQISSGMINLTGAVAAATTAATAVTAAQCSNTTTFLVSICYTCPP
jgi:hypothetical protein